jgi:hypothetical protein
MGDNGWVVHEDHCASQALPADFKNCGYHWTVTRAEARLNIHHPPEIAHGNPFRGGGSLVPQGDYMDSGFQDADQAEIEAIEQLRTCAKCSSERFSQRPITKWHPADPPEV